MGSLLWKSCADKPLQTLPGEVPPAGRSHMMVTASSGQNRPIGSKRLGTVAENQSFAARLNSNRYFVTRPCDLEQMTKVLLLCLLSSCVKPQQEYSIIHIIVCEKYPIIMRMTEMFELIKTRNSQEVLANSEGALSSHQGVTFIWRN